MLTEIEKEKLQGFLTLNNTSLGLEIFLVCLTGRKLSNFGRSAGGPIKRVLIDKECTEVYICPKIYNRTFLDFKSLPEFKYSVKLGTDTYYVFRIQDKFLADAKKMVNGDYVGISEEAKSTIRSNSGLVYNKKVGPFYTSSLLLQALEKVSPLKSVLAEYLGVSIQEMPENLLKPIESTSSLFVENFIEKEGI